MAVAFVGAGASADNATVVTQAIASHASTAIDDIYIAMVSNRSAAENVITAPDGTWTQIYQDFNSAGASGGQFSVWWKRATVAGAQSFTFTKTTDDNVIFGGVISSWSGCPTSGTVLDATAAAATKSAAVGDNVTFPAYDPTETNSEILFCAFYGDNATTFAAAMSGDTDPDCTTRFDLETATGLDYTWALTSGLSSGANIASRTWASASTADAQNSGVVFGLKPAPPAVASGTGWYPNPMGGWF